MRFVHSRAELADIRISHSQVFNLPPAAFNATEASVVNKRKVNVSSRYSRTVLIVMAQITDRYVLADIQGKVTAAGSEHRTSTGSANTGLLVPRECRRAASAS